MASNWLAYLLVVNVTLCVMLAFILLAIPKTRNHDHRLLVVFIGSIGFMQLIQLLNINNMLQTVSGLLITPIMFSQGVLLWFYVNQIAKAEKFSWLKFFKHLIPAMIVSLLILGFHWRYLAGDIDNVELPFDSLYLFAAYYLHLMTYAFLSLRTLKQLRVKLYLNLANCSNIRLRWLQGLCWAVIGLMLYDIILGQLTYWFNPQWMNIHAAMVVAIMAVVIVLAFGAIRQPQILYQQLVISEPDREIDKYQKSGLTQDSAKYYQQKLNQLMQEKSRYLDNELSLARLANELNMTPHNLSQLLNETQKQTFYDYINQLRVEYAKTLLTDTQKSVVEVAFDSGFNNKASFYNAFKKWVGQTPTNWRKQLVMH